MIVLLFFCNSFPDARECGVQVREAVRARLEDGHEAARRRRIGGKTSPADGQMRCQYFGLPRCPPVRNAGLLLVKLPRKLVVHDPFFFSVTYSYRCTRRRRTRSGHRTSILVADWMRMDCARRWSSSLLAAVRAVVTLSRPYSIDSNC